MQSLIQRLQQKYPSLPYLYAILSSLNLVIMQIYIKKLSQIYSPFYILYIRGIFLILITAFIIKRNKISTYSGINKNLIDLLIKRTLYATISASLFLTTVAYIPIGIVNSLFNTGPIFIHFQEAYYYNKAINRKYFILTVLCFIGVVIIIRPKFLFNLQTKSQSQQYQYRYQWASVWMGLTIVAAFLNSISNLYLHQLKDKVSNVVTLQYFYVFQTVLMSFSQNFTQLSNNNHQQTQKYEKQYIKYWLSISFDMLILVITTFLCRATITRAISLKKASLIMPFGYISIVFAIISDILLFKTHVDFVMVIGMILTSLGLIGKLVIIQEK